MADLLLGPSTLLGPNTLLGGSPDEVVDPIPNFPVRNVLEAHIRSQVLGGRGRLAIDSRGKSHALDPRTKGNVLDG